MNFIILVGLTELA